MNYFCSFKRVTGSTFQNKTAFQIAGQRRLFNHATPNFGRYNRVMSTSNMSLRMMPVGMFQMRHGVE